MAAPRPRPHAPSAGCVVIVVIVVVVVVVVVVPCYSSCIVLGAVAVLSPWRNALAGEGNLMASRDDCSEREDRGVAGRLLLN
eukprot:1337190-Alexandrium_andersonii.AAC.1